VLAITSSTNLLGTLYIAVQWTCVMIYLFKDWFRQGLYPSILCIYHVQFRFNFCNFFKVQFAENYGKKGIVRLKEIFTPGTLVVPKTHNQLKELESVHKVIITPVCYITYKFC
jgi:hypothetical protein